ncbi:MAG: phage tail tube protein [Rhizobiales bacterium]|nr:phage tail tube protein [Hyphomicrobiales bacterium]NRB13105.1 phage tail tube protein [Hyphomicrobiales bacterium]
MAKPVAGRITFKFNGEKHVTTGGCEIEPWNFEGAVENNDDGTVSQTVKPASPMLKNMTFRTVDGLNTDSMKKHFTDVDITFEDLDSGLIYYFNEAFVVGKPSYKSENGEISNLDFASNDVRVVNK